MKTSIPRNTSRLIAAGAAAGLVAAALVSTPAFAAVVPVTLSSPNGSAVGGNTITASSSTAAAFLTGVTAPHTTFSLAACQTTYNAAASTAAAPSSATVGNVITAVTTKVSNSKATIKVPNLGPLPGVLASLAYKVCIYKSTTADSELAGTATYTVATPPTFAGSAVLPGTGPALGGTPITISGTNFPTTAGSITGTLGGVALTSVVPISSTGFTAIAPLHAPGPVTLAVTTAAGTLTKTNAYTYSNGIVVTPSTAPNTSTAAYVDVLGAGFLNYDFATVAWVAATNKARVWLVDGTYDPDTTLATAYVRGPSAECVAPVVISDNELICAFNLATGALTHTTGASLGTAVPNGTYTITVVNNGDWAKAVPADIASGAYLQSDVSSGSTFTVAAYN